MTKLKQRLLLVACAGALFTARAADLRVVGTDMLGVEFSKALHTAAGRAGLTLALALDGSRPGLEEFKAGRAELGLFVFAHGEESGAAAFERVPLAYHRVVVLVPVVSPLEQLTLAQLDGIFGAGGPLNLVRWGELGLTGAWPNGVIAPQVPAVGVGLAAEFFRHTVLHDRAFKATVVRFDTSADLMARFAGDSRIIAPAPAPPRGTPSARVVALAARTGDPAFFADPRKSALGRLPAAAAAVARVPPGKDADAAAATAFPFQRRSRAAARWRRPCAAPVRCAPAAVARNRKTLICSELCRSQKSC